MNSTLRPTLRQANHRRHEEPTIEVGGNRRSVQDPRAEDEECAARENLERTRRSVEARTKQQGARAALQ